jgi:holo-[acyl-carrier protein] synthase
MSIERRKFPFCDCIVAPDSSPALRALDSLQNENGAKCIVFDLRKFATVVEKIGEKQVVSLYLSTQEQEYWHRLTSTKRKREWLGGRFSAKYAAAELLSGKGNDVNWSSLTIAYDNNGRPVLAVDDKRMVQPDISISHSADLAASMALSKGLCGLDIQKISARINRVRDRFCSNAEDKILRSFFSDSNEQNITVLTKLWAAKESLRKAERSSVLPGFLELELNEIEKIPPAGKTFWRFIFTRKQSDMKGSATKGKHVVVLSLMVDYILALNTSIDIVA